MPGPRRRVLIVEDDALIGLDIEATLADAGLEIIGPVHNVRSALACAVHEKPDAAVLDVNLGMEDVFPVADALAIAEIPFLFLSGHSRNQLPLRYQKSPMMAKPYRPAELVKAVSSLVGAEYLVR